jgi:hypothetical protein
MEDTPVPDISQLFNSPAPAEPVENRAVPMTPKKPVVNKLFYLLPVLILMVSGAAYLWSTGIFLPETVEPITFVPKTVPLFLALDNPKGPVTSVNGEILVSGRTKPDITVMVYSDVDDAIVDSGTDGRFETTIIVGDIGGFLKVTALSDTGEEKTETFVVGDQNLISMAGIPAVLGKSDSAPGQLKKATTTANTKANQQTDTVKSKTTATEKTRETTVNPTPKIISDQVVKFLQEKPKPEKPAKIGAGKMKELISLESSRSGIATVSVRIKKMESALASPSSTLKRHAISGVITSVSSSVITISHQTQTGRVNTIYFNASTVITVKGSTIGSAGELIIGARIAAVGEPADDGLLAKRIHVIPGKATGVFNRHPVATGGAGLAASPTPSASVSGIPTILITPTETLMPLPTASPGITPLLTPEPTSVPNPTE